MYRDAESAMTTNKSEMDESEAREILAMLASFQDRIMELHKEKCRRIDEMEAEFNVAMDSVASTSLTATPGPT
jgi:hypothetical protein